MRPAPLIASGGLLLLACSCYGPAYQQPYGYPTYPGQVQPGTTYPGGPSLGTPTFDSSQAPVPDSGGDAPFFNESSSSGGARPVPDYNAPEGGSGSPYFPQGGSGASSDSATAPEVEPLGFDYPEPATPVPTPSSTTQPAPSGEANPFFDFGSESDGADFEQPVQGNPISFQREVSSVISQPYGRGRDHGWLQGVVNQDPRDGSWGIIYDIEPDENDPYAGYLTIAQASPVDGLRDGQAVRLEGRVAPEAKDRFGRATYLVSRVTAPVTGS